MTQPVWMRSMGRHCGLVDGVFVASSIGLLSYVEVESRDAERRREEKGKEKTRERERGRTHTARVRGR